MWSLFMSGWSSCLPGSQRVPVNGAVLRRGAVQPWLKHSCAPGEQFVFSVVKERVISCPPLSQTGNSIDSLSFCLSGETKDQEQRVCSAVVLIYCLLLLFPFDLTIIHYDDAYLYYSIYRITVQYVKGFLFVNVFLKPLHRYNFCYHKIHSF